MGGTCQVVFREGTPPASYSARGGRAKMLPVEDTQATNKLIGVLVDNIHPIYHLCIKKGLENLKRLYLTDELSDYAILNRVVFRATFHIQGLGVMALEKFGRYEIKSEVGRGGMATVYYAYDPNFEREVAIKVLPREFLHDPQFRERFNREAKTIALIEHPAIVPVYDFGEEDGQPYIVMRYMAGGSLSDKLKNGPLPVAQVIQMLSVLAPALDAAHAKGIIHRDLKPGNILFDQYANPYISDFGIARMTNAANATLTGTAVVGTPAYMSPEQIQGNKALDGRSDIYALGVILFQMLTGETPYRADTPASMMMAHLLEPVPQIHTANSNLPSAYDVVVDQAMAKDPTQRFSTAAEMATMLQAVASGKVIAPTDTTRFAQGSPGSYPPRAGVPSPVISAPTPTPAPGGLRYPAQEAPAQAQKRGMPVWVWVAGGIVILGMLGILVIGGFAALYALGRNHGPVATGTLASASSNMHTALPAVATLNLAQKATPLPVSRGHAATPTPEAASTETPGTTAASPTPPGSKTIGIDSLKNGLQTLISYKMNFKYVIAGKDDSGSPTTAVMQIGTEKITASGDYHYQLSGNAFANSGSGFEVYNVGKVTYMMVADSGSAPTCVNMTSLGNSPTDFTMVEPDSFIGPISNATLVGSGEIVNNVSADHYTINQTSIFNGLYKNGKGDVWIAQNGGYVVKLSMQATGKGTMTGQMITGTITWEYNVTSVNEVDSIDLPKECQGQ